MRSFAFLFGLVLALVLALTLDLPGCRPPAAGKTVGVSLLTREHSFYRDLEDAMKEEAAREGLALSIVSGEFNAATQTSQVEDFVARKVSAIVVCPCDSAAIGSAIRTANRAGIPVFTADIAAKEGQVLCHVASDNRLGGRLAGDYLARLLGGKGKVLVIDHPSVTSVQERVAGFLEALSTHPAMTTVRLAADGKREKAMRVMEDALQAHPDLAGVFGINDDSALGALAALEAAGKKDLPIVGYDATEGARAAILRGSALKADAIQHPRRIGAETIRAVARHLRGEKVPPSIAIEVGVVDRLALEKERIAPK